MKNYLFLFLAAATLISCGGAKNQSEQVTLIGTLQQKKAAKTIQAYCAGGTEFYTLQTEKEEYVLFWDQMPAKSQLQSFVTKSVEVIGKVETYTVEPPEDPSLPNPGTVECIRIRVLSMKGI